MIPRGTRASAQDGEQSCSVASPGAAAGAQPECPELDRGAANIDVGLDFADVDNQSAQPVWSGIAHGSRGTAYQADERLSRQRDNASGQGRHG